MASRACKKVGFTGDSFIPSVTSWRMSLLPLVHPDFVIRLARASHNAMHQTSPWLWTSFAPPPPTVGLMGTPPCESACEGSMSRKVSGFFVRSVE